MKHYATKEKVIEILSSCGFRLAKWYSNCTELKIDELAKQLELNNSDSIRAIGNYLETR